MARTRRNRALPHTIKVADEDWQLIELIAVTEGKTPARLVNEIIGAYLESKGHKWSGLQKWGRPKKEDSNP